MLSMSKLNRKNFKKLIYVPNGLTKKPKSQTAVISDLFLIKNGWETCFELLNIPALIYGNSDEFTDNIKITYFDSQGRVLGESNKIVNDCGRHTFDIDLELRAKKIKDASTFAVFHTGINHSQSILAERGYTGYKRDFDQIKGYVHGNLDSVSLENGQVKGVGKYGLVKRKYRVQHLFSGPAIYEVFLTNPTMKKMRVKFIFSNGNKRIIQKNKINSLGICKFITELKELDTAGLEIESKLYLGRPVIFRINNLSFDVFHG